MDYRQVSGAGITRLGRGAFEDVLFANIADWLAASATVVLSGMITSRNGWVEVPYITRLCGPADLFAGAIAREARGVPLLLLPGLMRGAEVQILGALALGEPCLVHGGISCISAEQK